MQVQIVDFVDNAIDFIIKLGSGLGDRFVMREQIFGAFRDHQRMLTRGKHKLILYPTAKVVRGKESTSVPGDRSVLLLVASSMAFCS